MRGAMAPLFAGTADVVARGATVGNLLAKAFPPPSKNANTMTGAPLRAFSA